MGSNIRTLTPDIDVGKEDATRLSEAAGRSQIKSLPPSSVSLARVLRSPRQEPAKKPAVSAGAMAVEVGGMRLVASCAESGSVQIAVISSSCPPCRTADQTFTRLILAP